jgi:hypothetical protein
VREFFPRGEQCHRHVIRDESRRPRQLADMRNEVDRVTRTGGEKIARSRHQDLFCRSQPNT